MAYEQASGPALDPGLSEERVNELLRLRDDPEWVRAARREAWQVYDATPMPSRTDEEWRRTDISQLDLGRVRAFATPGSRVASPAELPEVVRSALGSGAEWSGLLVQHNTGVVYRELDPSLARQGVILLSLEEAAREHPELVRRYLGQLVPATSGKFAAMNAVFWSGGCFLYVPRGVAVERPIRVLSWWDAPGVGAFPRTLVVAEANSQVTYLEEFASPEQEGQAFANGVVEVFAGQGAQVTYLAVQEWNEQTYAFLNQRQVVERDATVNTVHVALGGHVSKSHIETRLVGPGATTEMTGVLFGDKDQHFDHHTLQDHVAPHTTSNLLYKGVLRDHARSVYAGLIRVSKEAMKTDAYQANRNLLLSDNAKADSIPKLEIGANDVRCTHGATVAPVDEEQVFYLMARGIPRAEAIQLMVQGFFAPIMDRIPLASVREKVWTVVDRKVTA